MARSWLPSLLLVAGVVIGAAALVVHAESGPEPTFAPRTPPATRQPTSSHRLELAGSGSNLALTRILAKLYQASHPGQEIVVHDSIGSTGGVRAVRDRIVDVGLVSRGLASDEAANLRVLPYARVAVVLATHPSVRDSGVTTSDLLGMLRGERKHWHDGKPLLLLQRERGDSGQRAIERALPGFAAASAEAWHDGRFPVLYSDKAMEQALLDTPGAVGLFDLGTIVAKALPLRVLAIDGVAPSAATVADGSYRFVKDLAFVLPPGTEPLADAFIGFARGGDARSRMSDTGYAPLPRGDP